MDDYFIFINIVFLYLPFLLGMVHHRFQREKNIYELLFFYFSWTNVGLTALLLGLRLTIWPHHFMIPSESAYSHLFFLYGTFLIFASLTYFLLWAKKTRYYLFLFCKAYALFLMTSGTFLFSLVYVNFSYPIREDIFLYGLTDLLIAIILYLLSYLCQKKFLKRLKRGAQF